MPDTASAPVITARGLTRIFKTREKQIEAVAVG